MYFKIIYTLFILIICIYIYYKIREKEHSLLFIIVTGLIATIIGNIFIPTNISIFDIMDYTNESESNVDDNDDNETGEWMENNQDDSEISNSSEENQDVNENESSDVNVIFPIVSKYKNIDRIEDKLLEVESTENKYYKGNINSESQIDTYTFVPVQSGRYRFEVVEMLSGVKVNIVILNQAGERVASTSYGVEQGGGVTVYDMIANEKYTVQVKQYSSYSPYKILLGEQKATINIGAGITQIADNVQYTEQRNIYKFKPSLSGRYRFEFAGMISGAEVNIAIYNPGGEIVGSTSYGVANGEGLTINDMCADEVYSVYITQYTSSTDYELLLGYQKESYQINDETEISDSVQYTEQKNIYKFIPPRNGRYRFEISNLISGAEVNIQVLNQVGGQVKGTTYGVANGEGLTIDDMVAGESYTIQIIQYNAYSEYTLKIGWQKETAKLTMNGVADTMQYTEQKNVYIFVPSENGSYSFVVSNMISGMEVNISVYNEGGKYVYGTSYGIKSNEEISIEDMVKGEAYVVYVTQYEGIGKYHLDVK